MSLYELGLLAQVCINVLLALSVYVVLSTGQLNLGSAGFMAVGAYVSAMATTNGIPMALALLAGVLAATVVGLLLGFPALRVTGIYLAMITFAFGLVVESVFLVLPWTGGARGLVGIPPVNPLSIFGLTALATILVFALCRSNFWLRVRSVHDDEFASAMTALNPTTVKIAMFALGGGLAGLSGGMYAHWFTYVEPAAFSFQVSVFAVLYVILGGRRSIWGPVIGATILTLLPEMARGLDEWRPAFIGSLLLLILIVRPSGLISGSVPLGQWLRRVRRSGV